MADLTFFQKYPKADEDESGAKSMRIDHPDFGNVLRCVYAKGVITDFEKVADDPIEVKSRVKVEIEGYGESEYLPLFFHPKSDYWDGPDEIKATDFNTEGKYFEKAWMSFRGGDEVAVLMRATESEPELKPFAVVAFADGVPRIGENIIALEAKGAKLHDEYEYSIKCSPPATYYGDDATEGNDKVGPDSIDLNLLQEATVLLKEIETVNRPAMPNTGILGGAVQYTENTSNVPPGQQNIIHISCHDSGGGIYVCDEFYIKIWYKLQQTPQVRVKEYLVKVGPIAYLIQVLSVYYDRQYDWYYDEYDGCGHVDSFYSWGTGWWATPLPHEATYPDAQVVVGAAGDPVASLTEWKTLDVRIKAAIYAPEMESMSPTTHVSPTEAFAEYSTDEWTNQYDDFVPQTDLTSWLWNRISAAEFENMEYSAHYTNGFDWLTALFLTRPHTKEELIECGLWPNEEEI